MRDVVPDDSRATIRSWRSSCRAISATCSSKCCSITRARSAGRARTSCLVEPKYVADGPERAVAPRRATICAQRGIELRARRSARAQARRRRGLLRETCASTSRTATTRSAICSRSSTSRASGSTRSARCSCRTAWCRRSAATSTTRRCFEVLTDDELAARDVQRRGAAAVPPPRAVDAHRQPSGETDDARRPRRICPSSSAGTARSSC